MKEPDLGEDGVARAVIGKKEFAIVLKDGRFYGMDGTADPETDWVRDTKAFTTKVEGGYVWIDVESCRAY